MSNVGPLLQCFQMHSPISWAASCYLYGIAKTPGVKSKASDSCEVGYKNLTIAKAEVSLTP